VIVQTVLSDFKGKTLSVRSTLHGSYVEINGDHQTSRRSPWPPSIRDHPSGTSCDSRRWPPYPWPGQPSARWGVHHAQVQATQRLTSSPARSSSPESFRRVETWRLRCGWILQRFDRAASSRLLSPLPGNLNGPWNSVLCARNPIVRRNLHCVVGDGRHARPRGSEESS
jgi:hypothetical protein